MKTPDDSTIKIAVILNMEKLIKILINKCEKLELDNKKLQYEIQKVHEDVKRIKRSN